MVVDDSSLISNSYHSLHQQQQHPNLNNNNNNNNNNDKLANHDDEEDIEMKSQNEMEFEVKDLIKDGEKADPSQFELLKVLGKKLIINYEMKVC